MPTWCLIKPLANKFRNMLVSGEITPQKLNDMTSKERRNFFAKNFGEENAKQMNTLFEKKILLKNQQRGIISWAETILKDNERAKSTVLSKVNKLETALEGKELNSFLEDLAESKVGFEITQEEFTQLSELGKVAEEKKRIALEKLEDGKWKSEEDKNTFGIDFGSAKVAFDNYYSQLAEKAKGKSMENIKEAYKNRGVVGGTWVGLTTSADFIASNSRAFVASWDNSFWGRQGRKAIGRPATSRLWFNNLKQSFADAGNILIQGKQKGNEILDATKAEVYSRENYLNGRYEQGTKLDVGIREEEFPTSFPEKIPAIGRLFKISEVTYTAGAMRLRADIADTLYRTAEKQDINLKINENTGAINDIVNVMTGRGSLGSFESAGKNINKVAFSAKFVMSQVQTITRLGTAKTSFAKKQAAYNLLSLITTSGILMAMVALLWPDRVEKDTRSTNFGKIKVGNVWIDITGGTASYLVLAERIRRQSYKNTYTGVVTNLNDGYGTPEGMDVFFDFIGNKTSPIASAVKNQINQSTFSGDKPTVFTETKNLLTPIIVDQAGEALEIRNQKSDMLLAIIADGLGFSVSAYIYKQNWTTSPSKELSQFKEKVGEDKFKEANEIYNKKVSEMYLSLAGNEDYQTLSNDDRQKLITKAKSDIKDGVFEDYGFNYETKKTPSEKREEKSTNRTIDKILKDL